jgi:hypothetical protein
MKIVYNKYIPGKKFLAINLFGVFFVRRGAVLTALDINHENIHTAQMREMLYVFFYLWYVVEFLLRLCVYRNRMKAYYTIRFEREAYRYGSDLDYLDKRKHFWWLRMKINDKKNENAKNKKQQG